MLRAEPHSRWPQVLFAVHIGILLVFGANRLTRLRGTLMVWVMLLVVAYYGITVRVRLANRAVCDLLGAPPTTDIHHETCD